MLGWCAPIPVAALRGVRMLAVTFSRVDSVFGTNVSLVYLTFSTLVLHIIATLPLYYKHYWYNYTV